jgi:hypothetical protein
VAPSVEPVIVAKLVHVEQLEHGRVRQTHECVGYPGMTIVCVGAGDLDGWTQHYEVAGAAFANLPDALNAWRDRFERPMRDRLAEVLRKHLYGCRVPDWNAMQEPERESWRRHADIFVGTAALHQLSIIDGRAA